MPFLLEFEFRSPPNISPRKITPLSIRRGPQPGAASGSTFRPCEQQPDGCNGAKEEKADIRRTPRHPRRDRDQES